MVHRSCIPLCVLVVWMVIVTTAAAQTPAADPQASWRITAVTPTSMVNRSQSLSPDGQWLAGPRSGRDVCVWEATTLESTCVTIAPLGSHTVLPDAQSFAWAPDSTAVAFPSSISSLSDSDLFVFEIATGEVTNLTDDGYDGHVDVFGAGSGRVTDAIEHAYGIPLDDTPVWSPDSQQIGFSRLVLRPTGVWESLMRIDRSGSELIEIVSLGAIWPLELVWPTAWLPDDTLLYTQMSLRAPDDPRGGIWRAIPMDASSHAVGRALQLLPGGPEASIPFPILHDTDPTLGLVSLVSFGALASPGQFPAGERFGILDLGDGALIPLPSLEIGDRVAHPASPAVFAPDGRTALAVYAVDRTTRLVVWDMETGDHRVLEHPDLEDPQWVLSGWASNDTVLVAATEYLTLIHLEPQPEATT